MQVVAIQTTVIGVRIYLQNVKHILKVSMHSVSDCYVRVFRSMLWKWKQDRHFTYDVTLKRLRVTIVAVEKQ